MHLIERKKIVTQAVKLAFVTSLTAAGAVHGASKNPYGAMNLGQFIQHVGERLDLTIAFGERVRTNNPVLIYVDEELPKETLFDTLSTVLEMQNYVAIEHKGIVRIVRDREARSSPIPVIGPTNQ